MPWKETCAVDERMRFIVRWDEEEGSFAALCREFGISRRVGYKWLARYEQQRAPGLADRPSVALHCPHRTPDEVADRLVLLRKEHPTWGPRKLRAWLGQNEPEVAVPAASTIGTLLKLHGLVRPRRRRLRVPVHSDPLATCAGPNDVWSADFKGHFALGDRTRCYPLTLSDGYSRYLLKCEGLPSQTGERVRPHFERAFEEYGLPRRLRTDNGAPFASLGVGGLTPLSVWWIRLGIVPERIAAGHPEQNGRHERMHRTLKAEATRPPQADLTAQQRAFDRFRHEYNDERPHEALGQRPPARVYALSLRGYPCPERSPEYGPELEVRRVAPSGYVSWRGTGLPIGKVLAGEPLGLRRVDDDAWELRYGPVVLGRVERRGKGHELRRAAGPTPVGEATTHSVRGQEGPDRETGAAGS